MPPIDNNGPIRFNNAMEEQIGVDRLMGLRWRGTARSGVTAPPPRALFARTTRSLTLTSDGARPAWARASASARRREHRAGGKRRAHRAGRHFAASLPVGLHVIAPALSQFRKVRLSDQIVDLIEGDVDLAIGSAIWPQTDVGSQPW